VYSVVIMAATIVSSAYLIYALVMYVLEERR